MRHALVEYLRDHKTAAFLIVSGAADARRIASDLHGSLVRCDGANGP